MFSANNVISIKPDVEFSNTKLSKPIVEISISLDWLSNFSTTFFCDKITDENNKNKRMKLFFVEQKKLLQEKLFL